MKVNIEEPLESADWETMEKIGIAIREEIEDFLKDAGIEATPEAKAHFQLGAIVGITRTLQWLKIRGAKQ